MCHEFKQRRTNDQIVRLAACSALITLASALWAAPSAPATGSAQPVLESLVGKHHVIGFTRPSGARFLGRVLSGDHGLYVIQTFHYTTAPAKMTETTMQTGFVVGRNGRLRPVTKRIKTQHTTQKTIADDVAVRALLQGVGGAAFRPSEQPAQRVIIAPTDITCLQELLPPPAAAAPAPSGTVASALPPNPSAVPASPPSAPKPSGAAWKLKTLWVSPASSK
jgi:hypothetical protein